MSATVELSTALLKVRAKEALAYLRFLHLALENDAALHAPRTQQTMALSKGVTHTLKANLCLLLYSAAEATLVQLLDEMYSAINENCQGADQLNAQLVLLVAKNFKIRKTDITHASTKTPLHEALFQAWMADWRALSNAKEKRAAGLSGNVDSRAIGIELRRFGVLPNMPEELPEHLRSTALLRAKNRRNTLAHGEKSFAELGRELAFEELREDARQVFRTLWRVVQEVGLYLQERRYLAAVA